MRSEDDAYQRAHARLFTTAKNAQRYQIDYLLGSGGMGIVLAAWDTKLLRTVAIKRISCASRQEAFATSRTLREASILAAVAHPNVVPVYDVLIEGAEVSIVMELVEGETLTDWLGSATRADREILSVFTQAGQGLVAAHRAGIVHRDFKPSNVVIGDDGRPRVVDFGIARFVGADPPTPTTATLRGGTSSHAGTPRYAAPEQFRGDATAASDQFSFCVALFEALCGEHPFAGCDNTRPRRPLPARWRALPRHVRRVLARGLDPDPAHRWPSMDVLLGHLRPSRLRRRLAIFLAGGVLVGAALVPFPDPARCRDLADQADARWNADQRVELERVFEGAEFGAAQKMWPDVENGVDAWFERFHAAAQQACEQSAVESAQACLAGALAHADAYLERVASGEPAALIAAARAAEELTDPDACLDPESAERTRVSPHARVEVEAMTVLTLGDPARALALGEVALPKAIRAADMQTATRLALIMCRAHLRLGDSQAALAAARKAAHLAAAGAEDRNWTRAVIQLALMYQRRGRIEDAEREINTAAALAERLHPTDTARSEILDIRSRIAMSRGDFETALRLAHYAREIAEANVDAFTTIAARNDIGTALMQLGRPTEAVEILEENLQAYQGEVGAWHPEIAGAHTNLGVALNAAGRSADAREAFERALEVLTHSPTPDPAALVGLEVSIARTFESKAEEQRWRVHLTRAQALLDETPDIPDALHAYVALTLAGRLLSVGEAVEAAEVAARGRTFAAKLPPARPEAATLAALHGDALLAADKPAAAAAELEPALRQALEIGGLERRATLDLALRVAKTRLALGDRDAAQSLAQDCVQAAEAAKEPLPEWIASSYLILAKAQADHDADAADASARKALDALNAAERELGPRVAFVRADVVAFLERSRQSSED